MMSGSIDAMDVPGISHSAEQSQHRKHEGEYRSHGLDSNHSRLRKSSTLHLLRDIGRPGAIMARAYRTSRHAPAVAGRTVINYPELLKGEYQSLRPAHHPAISSRP